MMALITCNGASGTTIIETASAREHSGFGTPWTFARIASARRCGARRCVNCASCLLSLGQIENRTRFKKVEGADLELAPHRRHDGPILNSWQMVKAQRVPANQVGVFDGPVRLGPGCQAV